MKIIVVGYGRLGIELSSRLAKRNHEITVIDNNASAFQSLPSDFSGKFCEGNALSREVLHRAGIERADALAAVTNSDPLNMVIGHAARTVFNVPRVVVRNYDPASRALYEVFGLQVISSTGWGAQRIEEMILHSHVHTVFSAGNGEVEIYEFSVGAKWDGQPVQKLMETGECVIVAVTRAGRSFLPTEDTQLSIGDIVHVSATFEGIGKLRQMVNGVKENA